MLSDDTRKKLENIVRGKVIEGQGDTCTSVRNNLCASFSTSTTVKKDFESQSIVKEKQVIFLKAFAARYHLWAADLPADDQYLLIVLSYIISFFLILVTHFLDL